MEHRCESIHQLVHIIRHGRGSKNFKGSPEWVEKLKKFDTKLFEFNFNFDSTRVHLTGLMSISPFFPSKFVQKKSRVHGIDNLLVFVVLMLYDFGFFRALTIWFYRISFYFDLHEKDRDSHLTWRWHRCSIVSANLLLYTSKHTYSLRSDRSHWSYLNISKSFRLRLNTFGLAIFIFNLLYPT